MAMKFSGGGAGGGLVTFGCWLLILIQELFTLLARQKIALGEQTTFVHRTSKSSLHQERGRANIWTAALILEERRWETWQRTEILLHALHHLK